MSTTHCALCPPPEEPATLAQTAAAQIQALRQERLRAFAEQPFVEGNRDHRAGLEHRVDELLDTLESLHRLEALASYAAQGGQITVDADRMLIALHAETYAELVARFSADHASSSSGLLPSFPQPID